LNIFDHIKYFLFLISMGRGSNLEYSTYSLKRETLATNYLTKNLICWLD
jgi:hypothetical protein